MQPSEKFIFLEYTNLEIIIPQKAAYSAVFCDTSCLIKDQDGNRKVSMNGSRIQFEIGYGRRKFLGRETQFSYTFELASAPGRFEPYAVMFNRLKFNE